MSDFKDLFSNGGPEDDFGFRGADFAGEPENRQGRLIQEKEVRVVNVFEGYYETAGGEPRGTTTFVLLQDNRGRQFKIFVLRDVGIAISMGLERETPDRPFTHDLMKTFIERLGGKVERVTIDDLWQDTFYAKIILSVSGETLEIDSRPSDAIALALRCKAPIYAAESVLEAANQDN